MEEERKLGDSPISDWEIIIYKILGILTWENNYEEEIEGPLDYKIVFDLIDETKDYFNSLQIKGRISLVSLWLYLLSNALRYLPKIYLPEEGKEDYLKASNEIKEYFESFEKVNNKDALDQKEIIETKLEKELDKRWDLFIEKLFDKKEMSLSEFQELFYDTFQYFRKREDKSVVNISALHILSSLNSLKKLPSSFKPIGCKLKEFDAARALSEDLLAEICVGMPGYYGDCNMIYLRYCEPYAGCSDLAIRFENFEFFKSDFQEIVYEFEHEFPSFRMYAYYGDRYLLPTFQEDEDEDFDDLDDIDVISINDIDINSLY